MFLQGSGEIANHSPRPSGEFRRSSEYQRHSHQESLHRHSHQDSFHSHQDSFHSHQDSFHSHQDSFHSHPDSFHSRHNSGTLHPPSYQEINNHGRNSTLRPARSEQVLNPSRDFSYRPTSPTYNQPYHPQNNQQYQQRPTSRQSAHSFVSAQTTYSYTAPTQSPPQTAPVGLPESSPPDSIFADLNSFASVLRGQRRAGLGGGGGAATSNTAPYQRSGPLSSNPVQAGRPPLVYQASSSPSMSSPTREEKLRQIFEIDSFFDSSHTVVELNTSNSVIHKPPKAYEMLADSRYGTTHRKAGYRDRHQGPLAELPGETERDEQVAVELDSRSIG